MTHSLRLAAILLVAACSDDTATPPAPNVSPTANAGADQDVVEGDVVTLDGAASSDPDGAVVTWRWTQTAGPAAPLSDPASAAPTFQAPDVSAPLVLTFSLQVGDDDGARATDSVDVAVAPSDTRVFTREGVVDGEALARPAGGPWPPPPRSPAAERRAG